jgi:hypothetical protein
MNQTQIKIINNRIRDNNYHQLLVVVACNPASPQTPRPEQHARIQPIQTSLIRLPPLPQRSPKNHFTNCSFMTSSPMHWSLWKRRFGRSAIRALWTRIGGKRRYIFIGFIRRWSPKEFRIKFLIKLLIYI